MTSKELSKLIREFVRKEIEHQKAEIIKEVKAEMFDALMARNIEPQLQTESVQVGTGGTGTPIQKMSKLTNHQHYHNHLTVVQLQKNTKKYLM